MFKRGTTSEENMFFKVRRIVLLFLPTNAKIIASLSSQILIVFKKINILWKICTYFTTNNWVSILINLKRRDAWCKLFGIKIKMQANLYWSELLMSKDFCIAKSTTYWNRFTGIDSPWKIFWMFTVELNCFYSEKCQ